MVRASHGVYRGSYYYEVEILPCGGQVREGSKPKHVVSSRVDLKSAFPGGSGGVQATVAGGEEGTGAAAAAAADVPVPPAPPVLPAGTEAASTGTAAAAVVAAAAAAAATGTETGTGTAGGHVRLGWSTRTGDLQAPVGFDQHSYGYGDLTGE
jgi:hypothetical protein